MSQIINRKFFVFTKVNINNLQWWKAFVAFVASGPPMLYLAGLG